MKTIQELNSKWWYRLLKVCYLLVVLLVLWGLIDGAFSRRAYLLGPEPILSTIVCKDGRTFPLSETDLLIGEISSDDYFLDSYSDQMARKLCVVKMTRKEFDDRYGVSPESFDSNPEQNQLGNGYTLSIVNRGPDYEALIGYSLLYIMIALVLTEILRRLLYYVVLGSIRPPISSDDVLQNTNTKVGHQILTGLRIIIAVLIGGLILYGTNFLFHFISGLLIIQFNIESQNITKDFDDISNILVFIIGLVVAIKWYRSKVAKRGIKIGNENASD